MAFRIVLEDETGHELEFVEDLQGVLQRLLPDHDDLAYRCVGFIDPYGDTVFNRMQAETALGEWDRLLSIAAHQDERVLVETIRELFKKASSEPHLYVKFYGD